MVPGIVFGLLILVLAPPQHRNLGVHRAKIFDMDLVKGPVGQLCLAGILRSVAWTSVFNGTSLWLVNARGLSATDPILFWTITVFTSSAAIGGILAGMVERRVGRQWLVTGSMVFAVVPLAAMLLSTPGTVLYFFAVALGGMLVNGGLPIMVVAAQDAAPHAVATASGMLMGLTWGTAGVMDRGVGAIQGAIGINASKWLSLIPLIPGALVAYRVLRRLDATTV